MSYINAQHLALLICLLNFASPPAHAESADDANRDGTVVSLLQPIDGGFIGGSGAFVQGKLAIYIATAAHVAAKVKSNAIVTFRGSNNVALNWELSRLISTSSNLQMHWMFHKAADCAVIPIFPSADTRFIQAYPLGIDPDSAMSPPRNSDVTILGFPLFQGSPLVHDGGVTQFKGSGMFEFSPQIKETATAGSVQTNLSGVKYFLLQDPGVDGFSGGPVYSSHRPRIELSNNGSLAVLKDRFLWGFLSATKWDSSGGKLGVVIHASHVTELIRDFENALQASQAR
jgi:hypothetical protein